MRILVVGSGGREHALAWGCAQGGHEVLTLPGNPGTADLGTQVAGSADDVDDVVRAAGEMEADLVVVGPEAPLSAGLVDRLDAAGIAAFGPGADGARIEASKTYCKELLDRGGVPTARWIGADNLDDALAAVATAGAPCVVKADGLAAGKGVVVAGTREEADSAVRACFEGRFGDAGSQVVVEECLEGPELSLLVLADGRTLVPLPAAQDHKRIGEGDTGPNTGGMGAYSPVPGVDAALVDVIMDTIIEPTAWALGKDGVTYRGVLYCGLMLTDDGPKVIEYNCRFGDPEAQAVIPRLVGDLGEILGACAHAALAADMVAVRPEAALTVVAAAEGYPEAPRMGDPISGLAEAEGVEGALVFHAGTAERDGRLVTGGGRVLAVTGSGADLATARERAYTAIDCISWDGMYVRHDIGHRALDA